jgi:hypothetical protein
MPANTTAGGNVASHSAVAATQCTARPMSATSWQAAIMWQ